MTTIDITNISSQSPYLYLQAAGSDGTDGSSPGIHLRWDLQRGLGDNHIPKGNLANSGQPYYTTAGYSKTDDYVKIYRREYNTTYPVIIDFSTMVPSSIVQNSSIMEWHFNNIIPVSAAPTNTSNVVIRFDNLISYNAAISQYDPTTNPSGFLSVYNDVLEAEVTGKLCFSVDFEMTSTNSSPMSLKAESITDFENFSSDDQLFITCRKTFNVTSESKLLQETSDDLLKEDGGELLLDDGGTSTPSIINENIKYFRFKGINGYTSVIRLYTYYDYLIGVNNDAITWTEIGSFGLSLDDSTIYQQLEDPLFYTIDQQWPKFQNGTTVNVNNYKSRWSPTSGAPAPGLKYTIQQYLQLSMAADNLTALTPVTDNEIPDFKIGTWTIGAGGNDMPVPLLPILKISAFDFHIARMMGLGCIDSENGNSQYIYTAVYQTTATLEPGASANPVTHVYMTLPTSRADYKLPPAPVLQPISYGYITSQSTDDPTPFTDSNGYVQNEQLRYVNLNVSTDTSDFFLPLVPFFMPDPGTDFNFNDITAPVFYGIEYKLKDAPAWQRPEISHDPFYIGSDNYLETAGVILSNSNTYTHLETNSGIHDYAMYGINWFSRPSTLSNTVETDNTEFHVVNKLIPPLNFAAQLIQTETVLMFTTEAEQQMLTDITADDKTLVRVTFDWNNVNIMNYADANQVDFFFRTTAPIKVQGIIISDPVEISTGVYQVGTGGFLMQSVSPPQFVMPVIQPGTENNFVNSFLSINGVQYLVTAVQQGVSPAGPIFTITPIKQTQSVQADTGGPFTTVNDITLPSQNDYFSIVENTSVDTDWATKLSHNVQLIKFLKEDNTLYTETITFGDGRTQIVNVGGIYEQATITEFEDKNANGFIPGSHTGLYSIQFNTYQLVDPLQANVSWYKGTIRIPTHQGTGDMRTLDVHNIDNSGSTLVIIAYDSTFNVDQYYNPTNGYKPIPTGSMYVNFHPGYKAYLMVEDGFNNSTILPPASPDSGSDSDSRFTFMSCRADDTTKPIYSYLSSISMLIARKIVPPLPPGIPSGPTYATRPDFYGKATYTFDTPMDTEGKTRWPYSLIFYRSDEWLILSAIYANATVYTVLNHLSESQFDATRTSIWNSFVNGDFENLTDYEFPDPDNPFYKIPDPNPTNPPIYPFKGGGRVLNDNGLVEGSGVIFGTEDLTFRQVVMLAINGAFLPLTRQPVLYQYIKEGYQTVNKKPVIKDNYGNLLAPTDPSYDPSPMAVVYNVDTATPMVRFTDYTLDGASKRIYFYFVVEMTNTLQMGARSIIMGPISLVNSYAPQAPEIKSIITQTDDSNVGTATSVVFEINNYLDSDGIAQLLIYRAFDLTDALDPRTMSLAATINIGDPIIDDFSDLDYLPFGENLYYSLVAVRKIKNEFGEDEYIPSYPSKAILSNIIDVTNPTAPTITPAITPDITNPSTQIDVTLSWDPTTYNATYYLYQMNTSGNWVQLYNIASSNTTMTYNVGALTKIDDDGNTLYYQFKVMVQNASGLFNLSDNQLTV